MKSKRLLKFYFSAENLERYFDNLIYRKAISSAGGGGCADCAEEIIGIIGVKDAFGKLWEKLDCVLSDFSERELRVLEFYGGLRRGLRSFAPELRKEIFRVTMKFARRMKRAGDFSDGAALVDKYLCVMNRA